MTDPRHAIIAEAISASRETLRGYLIDERLFSAMADQIIAALDAARPVEQPADDGSVAGLIVSDLRDAVADVHADIAADIQEGRYDAEDAADPRDVYISIPQDKVLHAAATIERQQAEIARLTKERDKARKHGAVARIRENAAEDARISASDRATAAEAEVADMRAKLATAEEDTKRLDFLDTMNKALNEHYGTTYKWRMILNHNVTRLFFGDYGMLVDLHDSEGGNKGRQSCRDAIDEHRRARTALAAIKEDRT